MEAIFFICGVFAGWLLNVFLDDSFNKRFDKLQEEIHRLEFPLE